MLETTADVEGLQKGERKYVVPIAQFSTLAAVHESAFTSAEVDDLTQLADVSEPTMLHSLRARYARDAIYTYVGSTLVSVWSVIYAFGSSNVYPGESLQSSPLLPAVCGNRL